MGAPTSAIIAEGYIQYMEHTQTNRGTSYGSPNISNNSRKIYTVYGTYTNISTSYGSPNIGNNSRNIYTVWNIHKYTRWIGYGSPNIGNNSRNIYTIYGTYTNKEMD
jgi:hypothetical protein